MHDAESILVCAAHPDDEVLGCGGTIARHRREGHRVHIAILGEGITSRYEKKGRDARRDLRRLHQNCAHAARDLGVRDVEILSLPDNRFDTVPLLSVVRIVERVIARHRPTVVYTHHGGDLNVDHRIVHQAVLTATRPKGAGIVREVYAFEIPSSTDWAFQSSGPGFRPTAFVEISRTLETKLTALSRYEGEVPGFPHPRSLEAVRAAAVRWGSVVGCAAAEAFELVRAIRFGG